MLSVLWLLDLMAVGPKAVRGLGSLLHTALSGKFCIGFQALLKFCSRSKLVGWVFVTGKLLE